MKVTILVISLVILLESLLEIMKDREKVHTKQHSLEIIREIFLVNIRESTQGIILVIVL